MARTSSMISRVTQWILIGICLVVTLLYFMIGYGEPYELDPSKNEPALLGVFLGLIYAMIGVGFLAVVVCVLWKLVALAKKLTRASYYPRNIVVECVVQAVVWIIALVAFILCLILSGAAEPVVMNDGSVCAQGDAETAVQWINMIYILVALFFGALVLRLFGLFRAGNR